MFDGIYKCFRTTYSTPITMDGIIYSSVETAYQAQKCPDRRNEFVDVTPSKAMLLGHTVELRKDWNDVRVPLMLRLNIEKFSQYEDLRQILIGTGKKKIVHTNRFHSNYWGVCTCEHCTFAVTRENMLGEILMQTREKVR